MFLVINRLLISPSNLQGSETDAAVSAFLFYNKGTSGTYQSSVCHGRAIENGKINPLIARKQ